MLYSEGSGFNVVRSGAVGGNLPFLGEPSFPEKTPASDALTSLVQIPFLCPSHQEGCLAR